MKLSKLILVFLFAAIILVSYSESRRIRRRRSEALEYLKALGQGFLAGLLDIAGTEINECLPGEAQGKYLAQDIEEKAEEKKEASGILETIWSGLKWCLDLACSFKDQVKKFFGWGRRRHRRRHRRNRRIFLSKRARGILDWFRSAWEWVKGAVTSFASWCGRQWENLMEFTAEAWKEVKAWTEKVWEELKEKVKAAWEYAKKIKDKIVAWVINKMLPVLSLVLKCGKLLLTLVSKIIGIISAIVQIASGNLLKIVDVIINIICSYQTVIKVIFIF